MNNDFLSLVRRFGNDFHSWLRHSWKSLPNKKSLFTVTHALFFISIAFDYLFNCLFMVTTRETPKLHIKGLLFREIHQRRMDYPYKGVMMRKEFPRRDMKETILSGRMFMYHYCLMLFPVLFCIFRKSKNHCFSIVIKKEKNLCMKNYGLSVVYFA